MRETLDRAVQKSEISQTYASGCMNISVALFEVMTEECGTTPTLLLIERPSKIQSTVDHFVLANGWFSPGEWANIETYSDSQKTWYIDSKGVRNSIKPILEDLYGENNTETIRKAGIFKKNNIDRAKKHPQYDRAIKNDFKSNIIKHL